jgi:hypothetical protein
MGNSKMRIQGMRIGERGVVVCIYSTDEKGDGR